VDGKQKIMFAMTSIKGIGRRFSNIVCKKADIDMNKRSVLSFIDPFPSAVRKVSGSDLRLVRGNWP
jgi:hypothetical protein